MDAEEHPQPLPLPIAVAPGAVGPAAAAPALEAVPVAVPVALPVAATPSSPVEAAPAIPFAAAVQESILDYASPRPQVKMRLPARSRIFCQDTADGVRIVESLAGKADAIGAMLFAVFILVEWAAIFFNQRELWPIRLKNVGSDFLLLLCWLGYLSLLVLVVHQTWRKTVLIASAEGVWLGFVSPLHRRAYQWPAVDVDQIVVLPTDTRARWPLGELRIILASGGRAHLFTDHRLRELNDLAERLRAALRASAEG